MASHAENVSMSWCHHLRTRFDCYLPADGCPIFVFTHPTVLTQLELIVNVTRRRDQFSDIDWNKMVFVIGFPIIFSLYENEDPMDCRTGEIIMKTTEWGILSTGTPVEITKQKSWVRRTKGFCLGDFWGGSGWIEHRTSVVFIFIPWFIEFIYS